MMFEEAIRDYETAKEEAKENASQKLMFKIRFQLGKTYRRVASNQRNPDQNQKVVYLQKSIEELKAATQNNLTTATSTDLAAVFNNLGLSYFENDQFGDAVNQYTQAINKEDLGRKQELSFYYKNRGLA